MIKSILYKYWYNLHKKAFFGALFHTSFFPLAFTAGCKNEEDVVNNQPNDPPAGADTTFTNPIYHANINPGQGCVDARNPRIQKFSLNTDGTPNFGEPVQIYTRIARPSGEVK